METKYFVYVNVPEKRHWAVEIPKQECAIEGCKNTFHIGGPYCEPHTLEHLGVEIDESLVPAFGRGVIATKVIRKSKWNGENMDGMWLPYSGEYLTDAEQDERFGDNTMPYGLSLYRGMKIDGATCTSQDGCRIRPIGSMVNHYPKNRAPNAEFRQKYGMLWIQPRRDIKVGEEIYVDYLNTYDPATGGANRKQKKPDKEYKFDEKGVFMKDVYHKAGGIVRCVLGTPQEQNEFNVTVPVVDMGVPRMPKLFPLLISNDFEHRMGNVPGRISLLPQRVDIVAQSQQNGDLEQRDVFEQAVENVLEPVNDVPMEDIEVRSLMPNSVPIEQQEDEHESFSDLLPPAPAPAPLIEPAEDPVIEPVEVDVEAPMPHHGTHWSHLDDFETYVRHYMGIKKYPTQSYVPEDVFHSIRHMLKKHFVAHEYFSEATQRFRKYRPYAHNHGDHWRYLNNFSRYMTEWAKLRNYKKISETEHQTVIEMLRGQFDAGRYLSIVTKRFRKHRD